MNLARSTSVLPMILFLATVAGAQAPTDKADTKAVEKAADKSPDKPAGSYSGRTDSRPYDAIFLKNQTSSIQGNEILTSLRLMLEPDVKLFLDQSQNAILVRCSAEQLALIKRIVSDLDTPARAYRVTYTISEMDGEKRVGVQHFAVAATAGQRTELKEGSRVPIATSSTNIEYFDVGLNFDFTADDLAGAVQLKSKVDQSAIVVSQSSDAAPARPVIRQSTLEGISVVPLSKPTVLGSLDVPGSTRHLNIEVDVEPLR
jgi:type II secretory pathway component GspD/PulD (secretin)